MVILQKEEKKQTEGIHIDQALLEVTDLKKHFPIKSGIIQKTTGYTKALDGLSIKVNKGETFGIVGESGCGKSTAGRTIIRLYEPTSGQIIFKGKDITNLSERKLRKVIRKEIQMIFQDPIASLNPRKTLHKTLVEPLKTHNLYASKREQTNKVKEILEVVGLNASFINRYPHEFSGGQRQRIGIARALLLQPNLIIADEPVSALDVSIQAQIINLIQELQKEFNLTYIFISHDLSVVRYICDRVAVMYLGRMMEVAAKQTLFEEPLHPYTQALMSAVPVLRKKGGQQRERIVLKGDMPSPANPPKGCVFHTRCFKAMPICKEMTPQFKEVKKDHHIACHLY
ncbi:peptide/nickel transport system ATP-binding protein/oligopeptide transport system ATP-binding protein [Pseudogracilibacillus auburnensis]|uniref:Peptide/nickel transport system ATP-binding protein/oligopeptide transport system ATP-binding protein n=1 Tax=Pseudogracilibacillus auburnensis TaxID=1494959 RepID=A0A2V3VPA4_9BACI|nr:peptide/nickel transport system ATP-binding protein/oligopeptide transport system ATP-binding protein [Pseudogracilibacillus auburnensis]